MRSNLTAADSVPGQSWKNTRTTVSDRGEAPRGYSPPVNPVTASLARVAYFLVFGSTSLGIDPIRPRGGADIMSYALVASHISRRRISLKEARQIALQTLRTAEARRQRWVEEDAQRIWLLESMS